MFRSIALAKAFISAITVEENIIAEMLKNSGYENARE
jgi:hypothetical protein